MKYHACRDDSRHFVPRIPVLVCLVLACSVASPAAEAFVYTVGRSGTGNNCSYATVQEALDKAASTPEDDEIWITRDTGGGYYQGQALTANKPALVGASGPGKLKILGGLDDCFDVVPEGVTELHGNGGAQAPVLTIHAYDVVLERLRLTRGDATTSAVAAGGGVNYVGNGSLEIRSSTIDNNEAGRGAGVSVAATGGNAAVTIRDSQVGDNRAVSVGGGILLLSIGGQVVLRGLDDVGIKRNFAGDGGGGIAMSPNSILLLDGMNLQVDLNGTLGDGGAILAVPPAVVSIGASPVAGSDGTFTRNEARNGGAIAVGDHPALGNGSGEATVWLISNVPERPQSFAFNRAHAHGGFLAASSGAASIDVCSWNIAIWGNEADEKGSVAYLDGVHADYTHGPACVTQPACAGACNLVQANREPGGQPAGGSLYAVENGARLDLSHARVVQNNASYLFRQDIRMAGTAEPSVSIDNVLIAWNTSESILVQGGDAGWFQMSAATIAGNALSGVAFVNPAWFFVSDSILDQPDNPLFTVDPLASGGQSLNAVLHNSAYQRADADVWRGAPTWFDASAMDYRLRSSSLGIDMARHTESGIDAFGRERSVDIWWRANGAGPRDLGAIETQAYEDDESDLIFVADFEAI